jgi:hypothetical protein
MNTTSFPKKSVKYVRNSEFAIRNFINLNEINIASFPKLLVEKARYLISYRVENTTYFPKITSC